MIKYIDQHVSKIAIAVFIGGIYLAHPAYAQGNSMDTPTSSSAKHADRMERVEQRIDTMHSKLRITSDQESEWKDVADVMRENEADIHKLVKARHESEPNTAVEDLKSYETIADAHSDGLKKLIPVFETLYDDLSDEQKARADAMFGKFEGHIQRKTSATRSPNNIE